jgi:starch synthase
VEPAATYTNLGLPSEWYGALGWVFPTWARTHALDTGEAVNLLKGAIVTVDRILTVSKVYDVNLSLAIICSYNHLSDGLCFWNN